jgi:hypothetical protein
MLLFLRDGILQSGRSSGHLAMGLLQRPAAAATSGSQGTPNASQLLRNARRLGLAMPLWKPAPLT